MTRSAHTTALRAKLAPLRSRLMDHKVYTQIGSIDQLRGFMEHHVFAVWDFMSLLKALQAKLCCNSVPWLPSPNQQACRLINEIVLAEESDTNSAGTFASHFEQYYSAMKNAGANTSCIDNFISELRNGASINQALSDPMIPAAAKEFVTSSFAVIDSNDTLAIAAAFTYGREELLPQLFQRIVDELSENRTASLDDFRYYLHRHVELCRRAARAREAQRWTDVLICPGAEPQLGTPATYTLRRRKTGRARRCGRARRRRSGRSACGPRRRTARPSRARPRRASGGRRAS